MTPGDDVDRSVVRRAVLLCSVAVLAGCLGGGSSASPVGPPDAAWTTGDRLDTTALARQHVETLRGAGSFTMNHSESMRVDAAGPNATRLDGYGPPSYTRHRVALADGRYLGTSVTVGGEERTVPVTHSFVRTYTDVGETTVERPSWVGRAANEDAPRSTATGAT